MRALWMAAAALAMPWGAASRGSGPIVSPVSVLWTSTAAETEVAVSSPTAYYSAVPTVSWIGFREPGLVYGMPLLQSTGRTPPSVPMLVAFNTSAPAPPANSSGTVVVTDADGNSTTITITYSPADPATSAPVAPAGLTFAASTLSPTAIPTQNITVAATGNYSAAVFESSCGNLHWLGFGGAASGSSSPANPATIPVTVNAAGLSGGSTCTGTVNVQTPAGSSAVNVTLQVYSGLVMSAQAGTGGPGSITLSEVNGALTSPVPAVSVVPSSLTEVVASTDVSWLVITPTSDSAVTGRYNLSVSLSLHNGLYSGHVVFMSLAQNSITFVPVVLSVTSSSGTSTGSGVITADHLNGLTFSCAANGSPPPSQSVVVSNVSAGSSGTPFNVSTTVVGGVANWLSASVPSGGHSGQTPGTVVVSANPSGLSPGQYTGTLTVSAAVNGLQISVTLNIQAAATVTASPLQLNLAYQAGGTAPTGFIAVGGSASGLSYTAVVATTSGGNWLSLNRTGGATPDVLTVLVNPANLAAGNSYQGTVTVNGVGSAVGSSTIAVTLAVNATPPAITSLKNAASFADGPVSPGEIVSLFGTGLGPASPLETTLDAKGNVSTALGSVQALFNGIAAPLTYVSSTQINCVVPYEFAQAGSSPYVEVKFGSLTSNAFSVQEASVTPAFFTASNGTGQGAILNSDNTYNGSSSPGALPAAKGSTVQVFMTGGGALVPPQATGSVTCSAGCPSVSSIPAPALPVAVLVNNRPATFTFAGEAPGFVSGVLQVNVTIPPDTPSGAVPISISVGGVSSQSGVTVQVQ